MLAGLLFFTALTLLAFTVLARLPFYDWWIRVCDFPRLQLAVIALLVLLLSAVSHSPWQWPTMVISLFVLLWQSWRILPYTRLWPKQVKDTQPGSEAHCFSLLVANVLTPNRNYSALTAQIHRWQPDLVLTLESDKRWQNELEASLGDDWPYRVRVPQDNLYGMHLYSRLELLEPQVKRLVQEDIPSIHSGLRLRSGAVIRLYALHPRPPAPSESETSLWRDAELLLVGQEIRSDQAPCIVFGDLNDVAWSRTTRLFCRASAMLDPRRGRGMFSSFHARYPLLRWPLDHVFQSKHFTLKAIHRLAPFGSDHFPILAAFCYRPARSAEHEQSEMEEGDREQVKETLEEARSVRSSTSAATGRAAPPRLTWCQNQFGIDRHCNSRRSSFCRIRWP